MSTVLCVYNQIALIDTSTDTIISYALKQVKLAPFVDQIFWLN